MYKEKPWSLEREGFRWDHRKIQSYNRNSTQWSVWEQTDHFKKVGPDHCLIAMPHGKAMVEVHNPSERPIKLSKSMCISYANKSTIGHIQQHFSMDSEKTKNSALSAREMLDPNDSPKSLTKKGRAKLRALKTEKYPFLESTEPPLMMPDEEIIGRDITLKNAPLTAKGKIRFI